MYDYKEIENKWKKYWELNNTFQTTENKSKKFYVLDMFPYPSGSGLHVGHPEGYTATDIIARYKRFCGFDVLHPIGWDAFGLPAEQYAIKTGNHPREFTNQNITNFRKQLKNLGFSYDYRKEVNTTDPQYYKWTQWIFNQIYKKGLAELKDIDVNWCPKLGTVLANEEVLTNDKGEKVSERGSFPVVKKKMKQWVLKITKYADALIDDLENVNWPNSLISLQKNWIGRKTVNGKKTFHLHDWVFSRQRYWGEPFPIMFDENNEIYLIDELPVKLPFNSEIEIKPSGNGESPLANYQDWLMVEKNNKKYRRETNTMPQWAGSSWYYLAYIMKRNDGTYIPLNSKEAYQKFKKWMPVDLYIGGQEHATLHLIYARFWHKVLYDLKIVPNKEPFLKIVNQGMILGTDGGKMSKSIGNVISPDDIIKQYGADALRVYEMFMGPLTDTKKWSNRSIAGIHKWLKRVFNFYATALDKNNQEIVIENNKKSLSFLHQVIKNVTYNIEKIKFNLAISDLMIYINNSYKTATIAEDALVKFVVLISPFAPFIAEELYQKLPNHEQDVSKLKWPIYNDKLITKNKNKLAVQVNGKVRLILDINENWNEAEIINLVKTKDKMKKYLNDKKIVKYIFVKNKILNFIVK